MNSASERTEYTGLKIWEEDQALGARLGMAGAKTPAAPDEAFTSIDMNRTGRSAGASLPELPSRPPCCGSTFSASSSTRHRKAGESRAVQVADAEAQLQRQAGTCRTADGPAPASKPGDLEAHNPLIGTILHWIFPITAEMASLLLTRPAPALAPTLCPIRNGAQRRDSECGRCWIGAAARSRSCLARLTSMATLKQSRTRTGLSGSADISSGAGAVSAGTSLPSSAAAG